MGARVVEEMFRTGRFGPRVRLRVDLHGVSTFGPGEHHEVIRWEWIESVAADHRGVTVTSHNGKIVLPPGVFGLESEQLAHLLTEAGSIFKRGDALEEIGRGRSEE